jgi:hypothetical protein
VSGISVGLLCASRLTRRRLQLVSERLHVVAVPKIFCAAVWPDVGGSVFKLGGAANFVSYEQEQCFIKKHQAFNDFLTLINSRTLLISFTYRYLSIEKIY